MSPKPISPFKIMTLRIPLELSAQIPPEYNLSKFIITAIREKLERDLRK